MLAATLVASFFVISPAHAADGAVWSGADSFKFTQGSDSVTFESVGVFSGGTSTNYEMFAVNGDIPSEGENCDNAGGPLLFAIKNGDKSGKLYNPSSGAVGGNVGPEGALASCLYSVDQEFGISVTGTRATGSTPKAGGLPDDYIKNELFAQCPDLKTSDNEKRLKNFGQKRADAVIALYTNTYENGDPVSADGYDRCKTLAGFVKNPKWLDGDLAKHLVLEDEAESTEITTSCAIDGIGWIVCPVMTFIGKMNDAAFTFLETMLGIRPAVVGSQSVRTAWEAFRDIANIAFVIAFMVIVYSQLTSAGISNYGIKKMLPRIIAAAVLVNISFYICAIAVDISNIVGSSIYSLLENSIAPEVTSGTNASWEEAISGALAVTLGIGVILVVLLLFIGPMAFLALGLIILILVARQALVILLIVIAPLAFVAYLLPNTENWFKKWWKAFVTTLMVYPIVGLVFGASTLASKVLSSVAADSEDSSLLQIIALGVLAVPLFAVPAILKGALSATGSIGTKIAGLQDRANRGVSRTGGDRGKRWGGGALNATRERALSGDGALGRKGWKSGFGLGVGGAIRGRANRNNKYKTLEDRAKAAEDTYLNTNPQAASRRKAAMVAQQGATVTGNALQSQAKKAFLDSNETLEIRAKAKIDELELDVSQKSQDALFTEMTTRQGAQQLTRAGMQTQMATELAHAAETAHEAGAVQTERANSAARQSKSEFTERMSDTSNGLAAAAAGIQGASGAMRVVAAAKAAQSKESMETIQNIQSTLDYEVASDNGKLETLFAGATTTEERVAYAKVMRANGSPGIESLKKSLAAHTTANATLAPGATRDQAMKQELDLKEILAYDNDFRAAGRDLEVWANNEKPGQTFKQVSDSASVWSDQSAQRFASMSKPAQLKFIASLSKDKPAELTAFIARFKADATAAGRVKGAPQEALSAFETGNTVELAKLLKDVDTGM